MSAKHIPTRRRGAHGVGLMVNSEEKWRKLRAFDDLTPDESRARHARMMEAIRLRIDVLVRSIRGERQVRS